MRRILRKSGDKYDALESEIRIDAVELKECSLSREINLALEFKDWWGSCASAEI